MHYSAIRYSATAAPDQATNRRFMRVQSFAMAVLEVQLSRRHTWTPGSAQELRSTMIVCCELLTVSQAFRRSRLLRVVNTTDTAADLSIVVTEAEPPPATSTL